MRAMILAAGRGERMGELTRHTPKPLVRVNNRYLIEYALASLKQAGILEVVINVSYLASDIIRTIGNGMRYGMKIQYSEEPERLETGGGIVKALPMLGDAPFLVLSGDVITDYPLQTLPKQIERLAHLVLVDNPAFHPQGDFGLDANQLISMQAKPTFTFGNIGIYHPDLFVACKVEHFPLSRVLFPAIEKGQVSGEYFQGSWFNVGTPNDVKLVVL